MGSRTDFMMNMNNTFPGSAFQGGAASGNHGIKNMMLPGSPSHFLQQQQDAAQAQAPSPWTNPMVAASHLTAVGNDNPAMASSLAAQMVLQQSLLMAQHQQPASNKDNNSPSTSPTNIGILNVPAGCASAVAASGCGSLRWQSNDDLPNRRRMISCILDMIRIWRREGKLIAADQTLPFVAKNFESQLYNAAKTREEYLDVTTLKERLQVLIRRVGGNLNNIGCTSSSVSSSPMLFASRRASLSSVAMKRGWQSNADLPERRHMIKTILDLLKLSRKDDTNSLSKLPAMAKAIEGSLYRSAETKAEYLDLSTLGARLKAVRTPTLRRSSMNLTCGGSPTAACAVAPVSPSKLASANGSDGPLRWQSNDDLPIRRQVIHAVLNNLQASGSTSVTSDKLPHLAKKLEECLYRSAKTKVEYLDMSTLQNRLQSIGEVPPTGMTAAI